MMNGCYRFKFFASYFFFFLYAVKRQSNRYTIVKLTDVSKNKSLLAFASSFLFFPRFYFGC